MALQINAAGFFGFLNFNRIVASPERQKGVAVYHHLCVRSSRRRSRHDSLCCAIYPRASYLRVSR